MGLFENCLVTDPMQSGVLISDEARRIALQMARESIVLLKNEGRTLPLEGKLNVFVAGPNLESNAFLGDWVKAENPGPYTTDIKEGLMQQKPSGIRLSNFDLGQNVQMKPADIEQAVQRAAQADVAVLVVGGNHYRGNGRELRTGGENIDRSSIELAGNQLELIQKVKATGVKTVVVLVNGRPLAIEWPQKNVDAIVEAWEPGMEGGTAVAEILYGQVNPSGRLTYTFPRNTGQLQSYYNRYPSNFFRKYRFGETGPVYEFGHGLSYTAFTYSDLKFSREVEIGDPQTVEVKVTNTGDRAGDEVVLVYINDVVSSVVTPIKKLVGFQRIGLKPGESKTVSLTIQSEQLALWNEQMQHVVEPGTFELWVGPLKKEFEVRRSKL
jgi:beta-glucosidase